MTTDYLEGATVPSIICIRGMGDAGVGLPKLLDEGEDLQPVHHHHQWIYLGHPLLTVDEVTCLVARTDHQGGPVEIKVE